MAHLRIDLRRRKYRLKTAAEGSCILRAMIRQIAFEAVLIGFLLMLNGLLAMAEIAVVSARKSRLRSLATGGNSRAKAALELAEAPNRFLSTVQIGITLVGILAGAVGGATIAEQIGLALADTPVGPYAEGIGLAVVVTVITYASLVIGELVPKRIGLANPERVAMRVSRPMQWLARLASPLVTFLGSSTDILLRLIGVRTDSHTAVTEEEVKGLMQEGLRAGAFNKLESQIVDRALELDQVNVRELMTPRPKIIWLNVDDTHETIWHKVVVSRHTRFPVYEQNRDNVVGVVSVKAMYANLAAGIPVKIRDLMVPPLIVPFSQNVVQLLETFKQTSQHAAVVINEYGTVEGLVTLHDIMEAVVGDFPSPDERLKPAVKKRDDGSWLIDASIEIDKVEEALPGFRLGSEQRSDFRSLAGFVVKQLGRVPQEGECIESQGYVFEVIDMDGHRVDKVMAVRSQEQTPGRKV